MLYISNALYLAEAASQDTTNRPLVGWKSVLRLEDFSASSGSPAAMWSPDTYTYWQSDAVTSGSPIEFVIDLNNASAAPVNYIGLAGHNFYKNNSGTAFSYQLFYSFDGVTYSPAFSASITTSNKALMVYFDSVSAQFFRLVITSQPGTDVSVIIAHMRMGEILRLQRRVYVGVSPFTLNKRVEKTITTSDSGKYLGAFAKSVVNLYSLQQLDNTPQFIRSEIDEFLDHIDLLTPDWNNGPPGTFFAAWRPDDYPDEILYCHPGTIERPTNQRPNGMMQWKISGEAEA